METVNVKENLALQCMKCKKSFSKKSSLVRHQKNCTSPNSNPRQKSCDSCSASKSKCDLERPRCGRCTSRKIPCTYKPTRRSSPGGQTVPGNFGGYMPHGHSDNVDTHATYSFVADQTPSAVTYDDFSSPGLITPPYQPSINNTNDTTFSSLMELFEDDGAKMSSADSRTLLSSDAWQPVVVSTHEKDSPFGQLSMEFSLRALRTWPRMMAGGFQSPPLFHHTQLSKDGMEVPLAHCYTITKMWHDHCEKSAGLVHDTAVREMIRLFQNYRKFDEAGLIATLQALAIYMIILLFPTNDETPLSVVDMAVLANVQKLVNYVGSLGLVLQEEREHVQPSWEAWINITSTRRAVFALYLVHWSLSVYHGLPSFNCQELQHMPAPASRLLWQAKDREEWESHYSRWLREWRQNEYLHGEVAQIKSGICLDMRTEKWLEETDELGMLLMALGERVKMDRSKVHEYTDPTDACESSLN